MCIRDSLMLDCRGFQIGGGTVEIMVHISGRGILKEYAKACLLYTSRCV